MANTTIDHTRIRKWAERHGGKPAAVKRTHKGEDVGIVRIMFPKAPNSEHDALEEISWDAFFEQFEDSQLALLYEEDSMFSKLVGRDTVEKREHGDNHAARPEGGSRSGRKEAQSASGRRKSEGEGGADKGSSSKDSSDAESDLKSREYRDSNGAIHHHTRSYMERHQHDSGKR